MNAAVQLTAWGESFLDDIAATLTPRPGRIAIIAGDNAALDCCESGFLWLRFTQYGPLPTARTTTGGSKCGDMYALGIEVGVARCAPVPGPNGQPPTVKQLDGHARQWAADALALACRADTLAWVEQYLVTPTGPLGGCSAAVLTGQVLACPPC